MVMQNTQPTSYNCQPQGGFILHEGKSGGGDARYHNGDHIGVHHSLGVNHMLYPSSGSAGMPQHTSFQLHSEAASTYGSRSAGPTPPPASPQHHSSTMQR